MEPILFVIDHFRNPNAGTEGQLFNLVSRLDRQKFDPRLLVFTDSEYLRSSAFPCDYDVLGSSSLSSAGRGSRNTRSRFSGTFVQGIQTLVGQRACQA